MTTEVPEFLFALLEQELRKVQIDVLKKVAKEYELNEDELIDRILPTKPIHIMPERIKIVRRPALKPPIEADDRCQARIWNRGRGGQCTRNATTADRLCRQHAQEFQKSEGKLRHGWIHEPPSIHVFGSGAKKSLHVTGI